MLQSLKPYTGLVSNVHFYNTKTILVICATILTPASCDASDEWVSLKLRNHSGRYAGIPRSSISKCKKGKQINKLKAHLEGRPKLIRETVSWFEFPKCRGLTGRPTQ